MWGQGGKEGGQQGAELMGKEKSGVRREMRGVRMEKVGSAGIRVNGREKCGVRVERRGVRRGQN